MAKSRIDTMWEEFSAALKNTGREGVEELLFYIEDDFKQAPCSGSYHLAEEGGLLEHSLNVYHVAQLVVASVRGKMGKDYMDSVTISTLLHDLGKIGQFGKPNYTPNILKSGKRSDAKPFTTNKELLPVDHEIRSVAIASLFIDLTEDEQFAILYHNGMYGNLRYALQGNETELYMIVHFADMWASRILEKEEE